MARERETLLPEKGCAHRFSTASVSLELPRDRSLSSTLRPYTLESHKSLASSNIITNHQAQYVHTHAYTY